MPSFVRAFFLGVVPTRDEGDGALWGLCEALTRGDGVTPGRRPHRGWMTPWAKMTPGQVTPWTHDSAREQPCGDSEFQNLPMIIGTIFTH